MLLQYLVTFCRVVETRSFTAAAQSLNLTQPTVTKQVKGLEKQLGFTLIERGHRDLSLSPAGELVFAYAQRLHNTVREMHTALETLKTPGRGDLRVGAVLTIALFTLPRLLSAFSQRHPLVTLHVKSGSNREVLNMVLHNDADVGLVTIPLTHEHVQTIPLFDDAVLLVASPNTPWASMNPITPAQLSDIPMISYQRDSQFSTFVDANFDIAGIAPNVVMEFDSHEAVKTMVQLGLGVAMLPESAIRDDLREGRLTTLRIKNVPKLSRTTSAIIRRDRAPRPSLLVFLGLMGEIFPKARGNSHA